ncbi:hypothetical protein KVT40_006708 [Elsinoe batatas]|uniref:Prenylcysteine lyase domain-containing protein n=1 Tax=Elsinoe batatas TaxID=2601811 RepID=A0A8K0KWR6_9PEZI|nr:hypothetical protein KVT40_006708 [Elsinoe batatas]
MHLLPSSLSILYLVQLASSQSSPQVPLVAPSDDGPPATKRVAIIGAGPAGSSTAYHLRRFADLHSIPVNITIYDRNLTAGGRSTTIHPFTDPSQPALELGASIFVSVNQIMVNATRDFGLSTARFMGALSRAEARGTPDLGIWDGEKMVVIMQDESSWWDLGKIVWRYGLAPWKTMKLMRRTVGKFLRMYDDVFPFLDLGSAVEDVGLLDVVSVTGKGYMERWEIRGAFGREVVQASTRVNYAVGVGEVSGVVAMVCMATEGAMSVEGGNWRVFEGMVERAGARRGLGMEVVGVKEGKEGWEVKAKEVEGGKEEVEVYDDVVLAAPYQFADVKFEGLRHTPEEVPYVQLHVTLLTSKHRLNPEVFGFEKGQRAPRAILTTTADEEGEQDPGFNSISLLREVINPTTKAPEFAYKVFTMESVNSTFLGRIFGLGDLAPNANIGKDDISWIYRKLWSSYPYEYPRVTFEQTKLAKRLWYTGGMDSFISTMETNALMGKNVAQLMVDDWVDGTPEEEEAYFVSKSKEKEEALNHDELEESDVEDGGVTYVDDDDDD